MWRFGQGRHGGWGVLRGWFSPTDCKEETEACDLFLVVGGKESPVTVMCWASSVLSWVCAASGYLCLKSSVELEKIRKQTKIKSEVLVKTKHFNPGKGAGTSSPHIFSWGHLQNYQEAGVHVVEREDVFETISSPLSQVSHHLLCPFVCHMSIDRSGCPVELLKFWRANVLFWFEKKWGPVGERKIFGCVFKSG